MFIKLLAGFVAVVLVVAYVTPLVFKMKAARGGLMAWPRRACAPDASRRCDWCVSRLRRRRR
jgi:hypothetical protein